MQRFHVNIGVADLDRSTRFYTTLFGVEPAVLQEDYAKWMLEDPRIIPVTGAWLDVARTRTLAEEVFIHRTGIPDEWDHWPDRSTIGIPAYYAWVFAALAQSAVQTGDDDVRIAYEDRLIAWQTLAQ